VREEGGLSHERGGEHLGRALRPRTASAWAPRCAAGRGDLRFCCCTRAAQVSIKMPSKTTSIKLWQQQEFEEVLDLKWTVDFGERSGSADRPPDSVVEMTIDRSDPEKDNGKPLRPPKDAMVKRVECGSDFQAQIHNMPEGRGFLVSVLCSFKGGENVRSPWIRAKTLSPAGREKDLGNLDPMNMPRLNCKHCPCPAYIPMRWSMNSPEKMRCRCCGCPYSKHVLVEASEILKAREQKAKKKMCRETVTPLPSESIHWDNRECDLWFMTDGVFHPRKTVGLHQKGAPADGAGGSALRDADDDEAPGGSAGSREGASSHGKAGRVSVVCPTMESRHRFHESLWESFEAQTWPDKELIVVETYFKCHSDFLDMKARQDPRLTYVKFLRDKAKDWSIGLKRNIGTHLATGKILAHFDDDDLYAPGYLTTMVNRMDELRTPAIKMSSWFLHDGPTLTWGFCDPIAWGLAQGMDEDCEDVKNWAYGYGFSYVYLRQVAIDIPYQDINMGEDFSFFHSLQLRQGRETVALFHDDFGICLHMQHGGNTSNAFPIREVSKREAAVLDVAQLTCCRRLLDNAGEVFHGRQALFAHTPTGDFQVDVKPCGTVADFMGRLDEFMLGSDASDLKVCRVPPPGAAEEEERDRKAADVLGLVTELPDGSSVSNKQINAEVRVRATLRWQRLLDQAKGPMKETDRIGPLISELWIVPASDLPEVDTGPEVIDGDLVPEGKFFIVQITHLKATVQDFATPDAAIQARMPLKSTVGDLRTVLFPDLPSQGLVCVERPGRGQVTLQDSELLPEKVLVTQFKGRRSFYTHFDFEQARSALAGIKTFFDRPEAQARLDEFESSHPNYILHLNNVLLHEVYPTLIRRLAIPVDQSSTKAFMHGMRLVPLNLELAKLWLEVETLMRNKQNMANAADAIERLTAASG